MKEQHRQVRPVLIQRRRTARIVLALLIASSVVGGAGCVTTQPHVTAKVIFQQDDVAAEIATEWR